MTAIRDCLDAVFASVALKDVLDDSTEAIGNKNPNIRMEAALFLARSLTTVSQKPAKAEFKAIVDAMLKVLQ